MRLSPTEMQKITSGLAQEFNRVAVISARFMDHTHRYQVVVFNAPADRKAEIRRRAEHHAGRPLLLGEIVFKVQPEKRPFFY